MLAYIQYAAAGGGDDDNNDDSISDCNL